MKFILSTLFILGTAHLALATTLSATGSSEFVAVGKPSALKIKGQGAGLAGDLKLEGKSVSGTFTFDMDKFVTGIDLRDHHMKEKYLEVPKYPKATFSLETLALPSNPGTDGFKKDGVPFTGKLTLHGVTLPVSGTIDIATASGVTQGDGQFEIKISDFKIDVPKYLGITVADSVQVKVHIVAKEKT